MKDWVVTLLKDQPLAILCGIGVMYWIDPESPAGKVFTIILVVLVINAILQIGRWVISMLQKSKNH